MKKNNLIRLIFAALCLALCMYLPFLTVNNPQLGTILCLMHIPVFICGFVCGKSYGAAIGAVAPLLRFSLFGAPPMPAQIAMVFELAAYGFFTGMLYSIFPKKIGYTYFSLIISMLLGRVALAISEFFLAGFSGTALTLASFVETRIAMSIPGIILQLAVIPPIVTALQKGGFIANYEK